MFTLIGAVIGLLGSALPDITAIIKQRSQQAHDRAMTALKIKAQLDGIQIQAEATEIVAVHEEFAKRRESYRWIEGLISSVRPLLTYSFFALYAGVKVSQMMLALSATGSVVIALPAVWHDSDAALWATIIAFWFGSRAFQRFRMGS